MYNYQEELKILEQFNQYDPENPYLLNQQAQDMSDFKSSDSDDSEDFSCQQNTEYFRCSDPNHPIWNGSYLNVQTSKKIYSALNPLLIQLKDYLKNSYLEIYYFCDKICDLEEEILKISEEYDHNRLDDITAPISASKHPSKLIDDLYGPSDGFFSPNYDHTRTGVNNYSKTHKDTKYFLNEINESTTDKRHKLLSKINYEFDYLVYDLPKNIQNYVKDNLLLSVYKEKFIKRLLRCYFFKPYNHLMTKAWRCCIKLCFSRLDCLMIDTYPVSIEYEAKNLVKLRVTLKCASSYHFYRPHNISSTCRNIYSSS